MPELLQAQEPLEEGATFHPQQGVESPILLVQNIMGSPNDILLDASSTTTSALMNGLAQNCRVYDLTYLRCQSPYLETSGLLGSLSRQVQSLIRTMEAEEVPIQLWDTELKMTGKNAVEFELIDQEFEQKLASFDFTCGLKSNIKLYGG